MGLFDGLIASLPDAKGSTPSAKSSSTGGGEIESLLRNKAAEYDIDPDLFVSLAKRESGLRPDAKNPGSTAGGLFQFIDGTWNRYGNKRDKFDPEANADAAARMLRDHLGMFEGDYSKALAAHHVGAGKAATALTDRRVGDKDVSTQQWLSDIFTGAGRDNPLAKPRGAFADAESGVGGYDQIRRGQIAQAASDESPVSTSLKRGMKGLTHSAGLAVDNMLGDSESAAQRIIDKQAFDQATPAPSSVQKFGRDWDALAEDDYSGMFGTILKNPAGSFNMMLEQTPNSLPGMAFQTVAGVAGRGLMALGPVGAAAGLGLQGLSAFAGNFLPEGGAFIEEQLHKSGVDTNDVRAVAKWIEEHRGENFKGGATKAGVISAVDGVTGWMGMKMLAGPSVRFAKAEKDFFAKNGVNVADSAALQAARASDAYKTALQPFAADLVKASEGFGMLKRGVGATALDAMGEGVGEYAGSYAATGDASIKDAVLEGVMGVGQGAAMAGAQYGIGKMSGPDLVMEELRKLATANIAPAEAKPNSPLSNAAQAAQAADPITEALKPISERFADRALYEQIRNHPNLGPDAMTQILSAYRVATNSNMDPMARQAAVDRLGEFFRLFDNQPNFTMGASDTAPEQVGKASALLSGPVGVDSESKSPLIDPLEGRLIGGPQQSDTPALPAPAEEDIAAKRASLLDRVLATNPENPNRTFDRALRLEGFRDSAFTDAEKARIAQFAAMRAAPASTNGSTLLPSPSQGRYQHLSEMLDSGWVAADRGRLVGPNGEVYNLKGAGEAQFVRNKLNQKDGNGNQSPRGGAQGGTDQGDFGVGSAGANGPLPQGGGNGSGQANALPDTKPADGAVSEAEATGAGSQPNDPLNQNPTGRLTPLDDPRIAKYAGYLRSMAPDAGYAERGGRNLLRDHNDNFTSRTVWIPTAEWFLPGMLNSPQASVDAVERAIRGYPMKKKEKLHVQGMMDFLDMQYGIDGESHTEQLATLSDIAYEGESADAQNIIDTLGDVDLESNGAWADEVESMRALGFTEEQINEITRRKQGAFGSVGEEAAGVPAGEAQTAIPEGDGNGNGQAEGQEWFSLDQQTNTEAAAQFAQQQAGESSDITKEQADKERDAVPFSMQMQSQPKPQGMQVGLFTADGRPSVAAKQPETAKRKIFRDNKETGVREVHEVDAQDVAISELPDHQFFVFKDEEKGAYSLTEASTGLRVGVGETAEAAISNFKAALEKVGVETFAKRVADSQKIPGAEGTKPTTPQTVADSAPSPVNTSMRDTGAKAFADGLPRVAPEGIKGADKVRWLTGYDDAQNASALSQQKTDAPVEAAQERKLNVDVRQNEKAKSEKLVYINGEQTGVVSRARSPGTKDWGWRGTLSGELHFTEDKALAAEIEASKEHYSNRMKVAAMAQAPAITPENDKPAYADDAELQDALSHLGDVLGDVFGAKLNITGKQYGASDLLPAMSKIIELLIKKGFKSFRESVGAATNAMRGNANTKGFVDQITPRQWKAAYNSVAEFHEGTESEEDVAKYSAEQIQKIIALPEKIKEAEQATNHDATPGQKEAGNYAKGKFAWHGLNIAVETAKGEDRTDKETNGEKWRVTMPATYGYIVSAYKSASNKKVSKSTVAHPEILGGLPDANPAIKNVGEFFRAVEKLFSGISANYPEAIHTLFERAIANPKLFGNGLHVESAIKELGGILNTPLSESLGGIKSDLSKAVSYCLAADSKLFGNGAYGDSIRAHGFDSLDIKSKRSVVSNVIAAMHHDEVFGAIVKLIPVDVMHMFTGENISSDALLRNKSVLFDALSVDLDNPVRVNGRVLIDMLAASHPFAFAFPIAEKVLAIGEPSSVSNNGTSAVGTKHDSHSEPSELSGYKYSPYGADGDHVDVFMGDKPESQRVYVVNQTKPGSTEFDEHKIMLGYESEGAAIGDYLLSFSDTFGASVLGSVSGPYAIDDFKHMLESNRFSRAKPISDRLAYVNPRVEEKQVGQQPPGVKTNGTKEKAAAERLAQLLDKMDQVRIDRNTPEGSAKGIVRSVIEELRKERAVGDIPEMLDMAAKRLFSKYPAFSEVASEVAESLRAADKYAETVANIKAKREERAIPTLDKITVTRSAQLDGKAVEYDQQADEALQEIDGNMDLAKRLLECLAS